MIFLMLFLSCNEFKKADLSHVKINGFTGTVNWQTGGGYYRDRIDVTDLVAEGEETCLECDFTFTMTGTTPYQVYGPPSALISWQTLPDGGIFDAYNSQPNILRVTGLQHWADYGSGSEHPSEWSLIYEEYEGGRYGGWIEHPQPHDLNLSNLQKDAYGASFIASGFLKQAFFSSDYGWYWQQGDYMSCVQLNWTFP